jgi:hypothetical protein
MSHLRGLEVVGVHSTWTECLQDDRRTKNSQNTTKDSVKMGNRTNTQPKMAERHKKLLKQLLKKTVWVVLEVELRASHP